MTSQVLRPLPFTRWAGFVLGLVVIATGIYIATLLVGAPVDGLFLWIAFLAAATFVLGAICATRIPFLRADLDADSVTVHGYFTATCIPRRQITAVTEWPRIEWTDTAGRPRRTSVTFLHTPAAVPPVQKHSAADRQILVDWASAGPRTTRD